MIPLRGRYVLLGLLLLLSCQGCWTGDKEIAYPPAPPLPEPDPYEQYYDLYGFVVWSCDRPAPVAFRYVDYVQDALQDEATKVHELSHKTLMLATGSCEAWREWIRFPGNRVIFEAIAYCAQIHFKVKQGIRYEEALAQASRQLSHPRAELGLSADAAEVKIRAVCPT